MLALLLFYSNIYLAIDKGLIIKSGISQCLAGKLIDTLAAFIFMFGNW